MLLQRFSLREVVRKQQMVCLLLLLHVTSLWLLSVVAEGRAGMDLQPADINHIFWHPI